MAKKLDWTARARADLRAIDQQTAITILHGLARFLATGQGDLKRLCDVEPPELRLRLGAYRIRYYDHGDRLEVLTVRHRKDAYR